jgi:cell wall-associated NlpC family hydrolase
VKAGLLLVVLLATRLEAQGPGFELGRLFTEPAATTYRLGFNAPISGSLSGGIHGTYMDGEDPIGNLWGAGADLALFKGGRPGPYLVGGVSGGMVTQGTETFWGSWSGGVGYEVFPFGALALGVEGRYRALGPGDYHGLELGFHLGVQRRSHQPEPQPRAASDPVLSSPPTTVATRATLEGDGVSSADATTVASVVQTAVDVMGSPYRWGGDGEEGFDCSGLIRYAFAKHGVTLPRTSAEQAREGVMVDKDFDRMRPGDILTFSSRGDQGITHVGLYIGDRRFIHSASSGVQISVLDPDDISGRWWYKRWIGVRRVVGWIGGS